MIISGTILVLASYVGPQRSPDSNYYPTPRQEARIINNHSDYTRPGFNRNYTPPKAPKQEPPKPGRMVVPKQFL